MSLTANAIAAERQLPNETRVPRYHQELSPSPDKIKQPRNLHPIQKSALAELHSPPSSILCPTLLGLLTTPLSSNCSCNLPAAAHSTMDSIKNHPAAQSVKNTVANGEVSVQTTSDGVQGVTRASANMHFVRLVHLDRRPAIKPLRDIRC